MPAHPQEAAVELAVFADEHGLNRRLHVVVDAARAGPLEESKGAVVRVEHHLLGLTRIGAHKQHPAVAQSDMRDFDRNRRAVDQHDLVRPVELVGLARRKAQRHPGLRRGRLRLPPSRRRAHSETRLPVTGSPCARPSATPETRGKSP